jgi:hypothetical protein
MTEVQQIENGVVQQEAPEPVESTESIRADPIEIRQRQIREEFAKNPIGNFNSFAYKVAEIAGYSEDCRLAHAAHNYLSVLYAVPYLRPYERMGRDEVLALCFHSHPEHDPGRNDCKCCDWCSGSPATEWNGSEDVARDIVDQFATKPIKTWCHFSNELADLSIFTGNDSCTGAADDYLELLMCQMWLTGEERNGASSGRWTLHC